MGKINILDSSVFNRIAAGEVVESPASVVKELVENAIDAGASKIKICIRLGGIEEIKVSDNGFGLSKEDLSTAFLPHATSKIHNIADLDSIGTLGFRGEALPSIASVSKVKLISRQKGNDLANFIELENGKVVDSGEMGAFLGTTIIVNNLFENVPARKKFLKKPSSESAKVSDLVGNLILANYNISFEYIVDDKVFYHSSGTDMETAIYSVYGEVINNLDYCKGQNSYLKLKGYVSKPSFSKHNKNYQILIVNGRVVKNEELSYYIYICYKDFLMTRQYPMYILYLDMPLDMLDVNVHPNKTEVKFSDISAIKNLIFSSVKTVINKHIFIPKEILSSNENVVFLDDGNEKTSKEETTNIVNEYLINNKENQFVNKIEINHQDTFNNRKSISDSFLFTTAVVNEPIKISSSHNDYVESKIENRKTDYCTNNSNDDSRLDKVVDLSQKDFSFFSDNDLAYSILGTIFNTYILVQYNDNMIIIDQHAAHERLIYDKYVSQIDNHQLNTQGLIIPYIFDVNNEEKDFLLENLESFEKMGFTISLFGGNSFSLSSVPAVCSDISLADFINVFFDYKIKEIKNSDILKDFLAKSACKAAVKGKMDLSKIEIESLLKDMDKSSLALFCPHGRPITVKVSKKEIEKWFKRIV